MNFIAMKDVLRETESGLAIVGRHLIPEKEMAVRPMPSLREDFLSAEEAKAVSEHNRRYAEGLEIAPKLLLAWLMLPTRCNQRCRGCYARNDKKTREETMPPFYSEEKFAEMLASLKKFGVRTIGYAGLGELFTMKHPMNARQYIDRIVSAGFQMLIFTNGSLLTLEDVEWLAERPVSLIISLRDIVESEHNRLVGVNGFRKSVRAIEFALHAGLAEQNRLGVEIPVIRGNEDRVVNDFIPAMRHLGIIPYAEQYMQVCTSPEERKLGLSFAEAREFFRQAQAVERKYGYAHEPCFGQRMLSQGMCLRPIFSVTIYPNGNVTPCPGNSEVLGNVLTGSLDEMLRAERYKGWLRQFKLCACSVFYTEQPGDIPTELPAFLEEFK